MKSNFSWFNTTSLTIGFAILYLPIVTLIVFSFNDGELVTVWSGFSTRWYTAVFQNEELIKAAWITLRVAFLSASVAVVLGTMAALILVRSGRFKGRTLFSAIIFAPIVMPEVITGLSLLLLFVALDIARGFWTITLAHITFNMAFVAIIVASRLVTFDKTMEEAALDLGCSPASAFKQVTLPIISPAILSAWLLAFTMSLDDLVIASFTSGPGSTTLPMKLYSAVRLGVSPEINALSTLLIGVVVIGVVSATFVDIRRAARREKEAMSAFKEAAQPKSH